MPAWTDQLRFAFQPVVNLTTGSVAALEILARPERGDVLAQAHRSPATDVELAALAVRHATRHETLLPLHVNLFAATAAELPELTALRQAVRATGRRPCEITLDLGGPYTHVPAGAQLAQGHLFAPPARRPAADVFVPEEAQGAPAPSGAQGGPPVAQFLQPAALLPVTASAEEVRSRLTGSPEISGVLLVDGYGVPVRAIDRDRFLLSLSGRYGHALYADRPALRPGDRPRTVGADATAWQVLDVIADGDRDRTGDDVAVVDERGRCMGVVRLADIVRALAESRVEEAVRLNPLTRLPGSDAVNGEADRRIAAGRAFALSWLDVDGFKQVNDGAGFAAGDELIRSVGAALARSVGAALARAASGDASCRVGHIGGDDFLVLTDPDRLDAVAAAVLDAPWQAGGRPVTLSLATVVCAPGGVADHRQAAAALAPLKKAAKDLAGASWVLGRPDTPRMEVRRAQPAGAPTAGQSAGTVRA